MLFILEVMKTEVPHNAPAAGTVKAVHITEGQEGVDAGIAGGRDRLTPRPGLHRPFTRAAQAFPARGTRASAEATGCRARSLPVFANTVFAAGYWGTGGVDELGAYGGGHAGTVPAVLTGTLTEVGDTITASIGGVVLTLRAYSDIANGVVFTTSDFATFYAFTRTPFSATQLYALSYTVAGEFRARLLPCRHPHRHRSRRGVRRSAASGRPSGGTEARRLRPGALARPPPPGRAPRADPEVWPVRIAAGAFAPGQPRRALLLSPDHAVFAGGGLIPARYLVNGATIAPVALPLLDYWHVELPAHDLLLAEGLAVESYLDTGNRGAFEQQAVRPAPEALARRVWAEQACATLLLEAAAQAPVRRRLLARAAELGWRSTDDPASQCWPMPPCCRCGARAASGARPCRRAPGVSAYVRAVRSRLKPRPIAATPGGSGSR